MRVTLYCCGHQGLVPAQTLRGAVESVAHDGLTDGRGGWGSFATFHSSFTEARPLRHQPPSLSDRSHFPASPSTCAGLSLPLTLSPAPPFVLAHLFLLAETPPSPTRSWPSPQLGCRFFQDTLPGCTPTSGCVIIICLPLDGGSYSYYQMKGGTGRCQSPSWCSWP